MGVTATDQRARIGNIALRLDPEQAFESFRGDIEHFSALDTDVAWVKEALDARFSEIPEEDAIRMGALLWPSLKAVMVPDICPPWWPRPFLGVPAPMQPGISILPWHGSLPDGSAPRPLVNLRHGLVEGQMIRRSIEADLAAGSLTVDALRKTAQEIKEWELSSDSARTREFDQAHDEVKRMTTGPERKAAAAFVGGVVLGAVVAEVAWKLLK